MERARISYQPGLDGLRAFAVTAVILYHLSYSWAGGGFLGVDAFFVLSGFLITSLLLAERESAGRISLGAFWARRARRLLPALFLLLVVVVLYASTVMYAFQLDELRGDAIASLFYVANWHLIDTGQSYFALFTQPSPLQHLWSLAIEEQFYLLWPLLVVGILGLASGSRRVLGIVTLAGIALSQLSMALLYDDANPSRAYYGTEARAHTLLIGCLLAVVISGRRQLRVRFQRVLASLGAVAFAACLVAFSVADAGPRFFYGGDLVFSILVAVVIAGVVQPVGAIGAFLGLGAFRYVGRISYGLYLWHWPVIVFLTGERTGLSSTPLNATRIAVTVAFTLLSFYLLEQPILHGALKPQLARVALPASVAGVLVVVLVGTSATDPANANRIARVDQKPGHCIQALPSEHDQAQRQLDKPRPLPADPQASGLRVLVVGDSIACSLLTGLEVAGASQGAQVDNASVLGCGVVSDTVTRSLSLLARSFAEHCHDLTRSIQLQAIERHRPDVIVWWSEWEVADLDVNGREVKFGTPRGDAILLQRMERILPRLRQQGIPVVILTNPPLTASRLFSKPDVSEDRKHGHLADLYREFAARHPGDVTVIDLARKICPRRPCAQVVDGLSLRPMDGLHLSPTAAGWAARWLWPQIVAIARSTPAPTQ